MTVKQKPETLNITWNLILRMKRLLVLAVVLLLSFNALALEDSTENNNLNPDSFLWSMDIFFEKVSLSFTSDPHKKIQKLLFYADERLLEMKAMEDKEDKNAFLKAEGSYKELILKTEKSMADVNDWSSISGLVEDVKIHSKTAANLGLVKAQAVIDGESSGDVQGIGLLQSLQVKKTELIKKSEKSDSKGNAEEINKLESALEELKEELKKNKEKAQQVQKSSLDPVQKYKQNLAGKLFPRDRKGNYDLDNKEVLLFLKEMYLLSSGLSEDEFGKFMDDAKATNEIEPAYGNVGGDPDKLGQILAILESDPEGEISFVPINLASNICPEGEEPDQSKLPKGFKFAEGCFDSDGGQDIYVKGTTTKKGNSYTDRCMIEVATDAIGKAFFKDILSENSCDHLGNWVKCEFGCQGGRCLKENEPPKIADVKFSQCQDSDGGLNYGKQGTVIKGLQESKDQCVTVIDAATNTKVTVLKEFYCQDNEVAEKIYKGCKEGCSDGRCKSEVVNIDNQVVLPTNDKNVEADGETDVGAENKENIDSFFDVNTELCVDSDEGKNYNEKGTATLGDESKTDYCVVSRSSESSTLNEYFCLDNKVASEQHACESGCDDGRCTVKLKITPGLFG